MRLHTILYDLDDTLVFGDKDELCLRLPEIGRLLEMPFSAEEIKVRYLHIRDARIARATMIADCKARVPSYRFTTDDWMTANESLRGAFDHAFSLANGAHETFRYQQAANLRTGVVTGRARHSAERIMGIFGIDSYLDVFVPADDCPQPKPHPATLLLALERLGESPQHAIYVGDHQVDLEAGSAAGMQTVFTGTNPPAPATHCISGIADIPELLRTAYGIFPCL